MTDKPEIMAEIVAAHGVPDPLRKLVLDAFREFFENTEGDDISPVDAAEWTLSADYYYDFLEAHGIGHRRLRPWLYERDVGSDVTLTRKGAALFNELAKAEGVAP